MADISNNADSTRDPSLEPARGDTPGARLAAKRAAKAATKASQRGTQSPAEEVARSLSGVTTWLDEHKGQLWSGVAVVAAVAVGWLGFSFYAQSQDGEAGGLLHTAVTNAEGLIVTGDEPAPEEPLVPTFNSAAERDKKALESFRAAESKFPSATATPWARLGEANTLLGSGKPADAQNAYESVIAKTADEPFLHARALEGAAYALEAQKKYPDALKRFEELSTFESGAYKPLGDYHRGRVLAATGEREAAIKLLEGLVKASAAKPAEESARFTVEVEAAQTLLEELGVKPAEKTGGFDISSLGGAAAGGKGEISQQVIDALRKQIAARQEKGAPAQGTSPK